jgi:hypothetical protein
MMQGLADARVSGSFAVAAGAIAFTLLRPGHASSLRRREDRLSGLAPSAQHQRLLDKRPVADEPGGAYGPRRGGSDRSAIPAPHNRHQGRTCGTVDAADVDSGLMPEASADLPEPTEAYRAIGRYVVTFSHLVVAMRSCIENRLMGGRNSYHLVQLAIGEATAAPLANSFFGMCSDQAMLEHEDDRRIARTLKANVFDEINRRNDVAHGDWWPGVVEGSPVLRDPTLVRLKPGRAAFPVRRPWRGVEADLHEPGGGPGARTVHSYASEDLDAFSDWVLELARVTGEFGMKCMKERAPGQKVELRNRFVVSDKRVVFRKPDERTIMRTGNAD